MNTKRTLLLDFDGVLHSYTSGWKGATVVSDPPVPGALEFLSKAVKGFDVCIYSSRSHQWGGIRAMKDWLVKSYIEAAVPYDDCPEWLRDDIAAKAFADPWEVDAAAHARELLKDIRFPWFKPAAFLTIDDRCVCFDGTWPHIDDLHKFKPWNKEPV